MLQWQNQHLDRATKSNYFFKFEWQSDIPVTAGWHDVKVDLLNAHEQSTSTAKANLSCHIVRKMVLYLTLMIRCLFPLRHYR